MSVLLELAGWRIHQLKVGDVMTVLPDQRHEFVSHDGAVLEEISSTHQVDDSIIPMLK